MKIKLNNRDGADLYLYRDNDANPIDSKSNVYEWKLFVDSKHKYVLQHYRVIFESMVSTIIKAVDPSGGPFLSIGSKFKNDKYEIVNIVNAITFWISERDNNIKNNS